MGKKKEKSDKKRIDIRQGTAFVSLVLVFFTGSFVCFLVPGNAVFFYQEKQSLFLFSVEYFREFLETPGGLLEYFSRFLRQFYFYPAAGAFIISGYLTLLVVVLKTIVKRLGSNGPRMLIPVFVPSLVMLYLHSDLGFMLRHSIGFLIVAGVFAVLLKLRTQKAALVGPVLFPVFYYLLGGFAWILFFMLILYFLKVLRGKKKAYVALAMVIMALLSYVAFSMLFFLQPVNKILFHPLPVAEGEVFRPALVFISLFVAFLPLIARLSWFSNEKVSTVMPAGVVVFLFVVTGFALRAGYDAGTRRFLRLEKMVFEQNWDAVIETFENNDFGDKISEHYYFLALSEKGWLCDRMFRGNPQFGAGSLIIPWEYRADVINRGGYFYYAIGLMNEAHRWAYESMVTQGYQPQNLKMIVKTNLVNGHYKVAGKYVSILKRTLFYKKWASRYEAMCNDPGLIRDDPELSEKIGLLPETDFFINVEQPAANLAYLLQANAKNRKAFEYGLAWALLSKNVEAISGELPLFKEMGYTKLPRHIEEAALVINSIQRNELGETEGYTISPETISAYEAYATEYRKFRGSPRLQTVMRNRASDTFWYYMHFN